MLITLLIACCKPSCDVEGRTVVDLETRDGVGLVADYVPASGAGRPGVVLLHENPETADRSSWPCAFLADVAARDWFVIVPDRRGAGDSEGDPTDAFESDAGRYDVEVAVAWLRDAGAGDIGVIGASNGTTSLVDYAAWAPDAGLSQPVVLGFLSAGTYTENQTSLSEVAALGTPALFYYPPAEADWNEAALASAPGNWKFQEVSSGGHGTAMLDNDPDLGTELLSSFGGVFDATAR